MSVNNNSNSNDNTPDTNMPLDDEVKKTRLDKDSEIYNKNRSETLNKEEFNKLSRREKFLYYKEYYVPYILIVLAIVVAMTYVVVSIRKTDKQKDSFYCGMMTGVQFDEETMDEMPAKFTEYLKNETDYKGYINADRTYFEVFYSTFTDDVRLDGFYDKKNFDIFITREDTFKNYIGNDTIMDLSKVLPEDLLKKVEDKLVYATKGDSSESIPYGILLDDIDYKFYDGAGDPVAPPILSIPVNTTRLEVAIHFIEFLFQ
ncbi:MAG: hypothetical protein MR361_04405 [Clostridiales bacterium]|nr:hypothetical protein [Clostridiales bacterium]